MKSICKSYTLSSHRVVDRVRRRPLLVATALSRAFLLSTILLVALLQVLSIGQLYIVAVLVGMLTVIFNVASSTFFPSLVSQEALVEGNGKLEVGDSLAEISSSAVARWLVHLSIAPDLKYLLI